MKGEECSLAHDFALLALDERLRILRKQVRPAAAHEVDGIHDLRVASRRVRAVLSDHAQYYRKKQLKPFRREVKLITTGLGKARELDVCLLLLKEWRQELPKSLHPAVSAALQRMRKLRKAESKNVDESCRIARSPKFRDAAKLLVDNIKRSQNCLLDEVDRTISKRFRALTRAFKTWQRSESDEDLHAVRIAFKKFRYSCEICQPLYGVSMEEFISHLKLAQEALGDWNDQRVLRDYILVFQREMPDYSNDLSRLVSHIDSKTTTLLRVFENAGMPWIGPENRNAIHVMLGQPTANCCAKK